MLKASVRDGPGNEGYPGRAGTQPDEGRIVTPRRGGTIVQWPILIQIETRPDCPGRLHQNGSMAVVARERGMGHEIIRRRPRHFPVMARLRAGECLSGNTRGPDSVHQDGASDIVTLYVSY